MFSIVTVEKGLSFGDQIGRPDVEPCKLLMWWQCFVAFDPHPDFLGWLFVPVDAFDDLCRVV
jgi:hypothetical protein